MAMAHRVNTYADLVQQVRNDLRLQHPEWIQPNGQCPMCDSYEARLIRLLDASMPAAGTPTTGHRDDHVLYTSPRRHAIRT
jgi:hypothetical protein